MIFWEKSKLFHFKEINSFERINLADEYYLLIIEEKQVANRLINFFSNVP